MVRAQVGSGLSSGRRGADRGDGQRRWGVIAVGLHDGKVENVEAVRRNELRQAVLDYAEPPVRIQVEEVLAKDASGHPATLLLIAVAPSESVMPLRGASAICGLEMSPDGLPRLNNANSPTTGARPITRERRPV